MLISFFVMYCSDHLKEFQSFDLTIFTSHIAFGSEIKQETFFRSTYPILNVAVCVNGPILVDNA